MLRACQARHSDIGSRGVGVGSRVCDRDIESISSIYQVQVEVG
jgi:hypothetical protein